jgi:hypothetical protein
MTLVAPRAKLRFMSTTATGPAPPAQTAAPAALQPPGASKLDAVRAFGVMLGGPIVLLSGVAAASVDALRALRRRRIPRRSSLLALAGAAAYHRWALPWMRRWGATDAELEMTLPGDDAIADAGVQQTHVVQVDAPASEVWPWVAQIGQDRGGFYSYEWLENLAGCRMHNADRVHPEWQQRAIGETVLLHPASGLQVLRFEPGRALVLEGGWSLVVLDDGPRCRLIARFRAPRGAIGSAYAMLLELPHFLMERRMLLGIKRRAERAS